MITGTTKSEMERKNFYLNATLVKEAEKIAEENNWNLSELLRIALQEYVDKQKREKLDKEISEACRTYADIDQQLAAEWQQTETNPWR